MFFESKSMEWSSGQTIKKKKGIQNPQKLRVIYQQPFWENVQLHVYMGTNANPIFIIRVPC